MRQFLSKIVVFLFVVGLTACGDSPVAPVEKAIPATMEASVRVIKAPFPIGIGTRVDPSDSEGFGLNFGFEGFPATAEVGPDGKFEVFLVLGEHELRWYSESVDSLSRVTFTGTLTPRAVQNPSITFGSARVVANIATAVMTCDFNSNCWLQRRNQTFAGEVTDIKANNTGGRFRGIASGVKPFDWYVVRAGAVIAGVCDPKHLNKYMVVEGKSLLATYSNVDPQLGSSMYIGDFYLEVSCRLATTPAYSRVASSVKSIWD